MKKITQEKPGIRNKPAKEIEGKTRVVLRGLVGFGFGQTLGDKI
jgi:hypothetical protein